MFEKEAKERAFEKYPIPRVSNELDFARNIKYEEGFKDGAEFGYNKANEWHSYAERPKEKLNALCFDIGQNRFILGYYDIESDEWIKYGGYEIITIDLWKKIVPPELPKEIE